MSEKAYITVPFENSEMFYWANRRVSAIATYRVC